LGLDTPIGEKGVMLSGGERQRLALARLFLNGGAALAVLDEATSALDPATEGKVLAALRTHLAGRTVLVAAHRPSALRAADEVLLLNRSGPPERGEFEQLRASSPRFRALLAASGRRNAE
ncbi:MAG: ABC transporter ATP-binding protein, partial [Clostridiales bacterium]|nr:ABC transporter ATP-binding protein [Clostridiales bacterium]